MKNLYVIPTDKPSRLYKHNELGFKLLAPVKHEIGAYNGSNQNIYITFYKEIKDGDFYISLEGKLLQFTGRNVLGDKFKALKVILTTDDQLIADGVQAIDDEFLEWFVKNPSCEFVPIITTIVQDEAEYKTNIGFESWRKEEHKQETLEEAAERYSQELLDAKAIQFHEKSWIKAMFIWVAKWQAERMYSEEEVLKLLRKSHFVEQNIEEWFEQHKKK